MFYNIKSLNTRIIENLSLNKIVCGVVPLTCIFLCLAFNAHILHKWHVCCLKQMATEKKTPHKSLQHVIELCKPLHKTVEKIPKHNMYDNRSVKWSEHCIRTLTTL